MAPKFPRLIALLFRVRFLHLPEGALGDLIEEYNTGARSRRWVWLQALSMLWPGTGPRSEVPASRKNNMNFISSSIGDLRYAARTLRANPGFTAVAVLVIALGIGINTGIFSVLNGAALRPLPVPGALQIVSVYQTFQGVHSRNVHGAESLFSFPEYERYRDGTQGLSGLLAYQPFLVVTLGGERPQQLFGQLASCNYFGVLNEPPVLGRGFDASDCSATGTGAVTVLSDDLWRSEFGADRGVLGRKIVFNRQPLTVIGVAAPGFRGTEPVPAAFWAPLTMQPVLERDFDCFKNSNTSWLVLLGRIKPGVSLGQVRAGMGVIAGQIDQLTPGRKTSLQIQTGSFLSMPEISKLLFGVEAALLIAVGMVLLIACANVANLLLTRAAGRQKEIAIRLSVGASRSRLIRQLLTESMLIAVLGGALGSLISVWCFDVIVAYVLSHLPHGTPPIAISVGPDIRVLGYSLIVTLITGVIFGLAPALQATRSDVNAALKTAGTGETKSGGRNLLRPALVGTQVAVSMVLLIVAGLFLRGLLMAQTIDPEFELNNISSVSFDLRTQGYDVTRAALFQRQLMERVEALPGVTGAAHAWTAPLSDNHRGSMFSLPGQANERMVELNYISPSYLPLLGIPISRGRNFSAAETRSGAPLAIVTESTARRLWPNQDAIGKTFRIDKQEMQVIGVAKDAQVSHLSRSDETYMYLPAGPDEQLRLQLLVRYAGSFGPVAQAIRATAHALDPGLVVDVSRLEDNLELWRTPSRIVAILAGSLGALGMFLACIGVYGVVSYSVSRRIREIGIRMTLGAGAGEVRRLILRQAIQPVMIGALAGIAGCAAVSQILKGMLFGISAHDPVTFIGVPLFLLSVALLASYIPARRATKVDPMVALRYE